MSDALRAEAPLLLEAMERFVAEPGSRRASVELVMTIGARDRRTVPVIRQSPLWEDFVAVAERLRRWADIVNGKKKTTKDVDAVREQHAILERALNRP